MSPWPLEDMELALDADGGSDFPIWEQVCASRASGLFLASSCKRTLVQYSSSMARGFRPNSEEEDCMDARDYIVYRGVVYIHGLLLLLLFTNR